MGIGKNKFGSGLQCRFLKAVTCKLLFGKLHFLVCDRNFSALLTNLLQKPILPPSRRQYLLLRKALKLLSFTAASRHRRQYSSSSSKLWQETECVKSACNYEYIWRTQVATVGHYPGQVLGTQNSPNFKYLRCVNVLCYIEPQSTLKDLHEVKGSTRSQRGSNSKHGSFRCPLVSPAPCQHWRVQIWVRRFHLLQVNKRQSSCTFPLVSCFVLIIKLHLVCLLTLLHLHVLHSVECLELWAWRLQTLRHM